MLSSIFSSEIPRAYLRQPAARKRRQAMVVLMMVAVLVFGHWLAGRVEERLLPHSSLAPFLLAREALSESTEVVFAGSSHVLLGIRPDLFSREVMSIAGPGWDYRTLEAAIRNNLDRMPNLRLAVIELDLLPMRISTPVVQRGQCGALRVWGIGQEEVPCSDRVADEGAFARLGDVLIPTPRLAPYPLWETVRPRFEGPEENRVPIAGHRSFPAVVDDPRHGRQRIGWLRKEFKGRHVKRNRAALGRLVGMLLGRGVRVVLLRLPHQESFTGRVPASWDLQVEKTVKRLRYNTGVRIPLWDYEESGGFQPGDFMDSVHLNSVGAKKLSKRLDERVRRELEAEAS